MAKDAFWFRHDSNAGRDIKLLKIKHTYKHWGIGIFWEVVEALRDQQDYKHPCDESNLQLLCSLIGCDDFARFMNWYKDAIKLELIVEDNGFFYSESLIQRMHKWETKKDNGAEGGKAKQANRLAKQKQMSSEHGSETLTEVISEHSSETGSEQGSIREEKRREEERREDNAENSLIFSAEDVIKSDRVRYEAIMMKTKKSEPDAEEELRKFHLFLVENKKYPYSRQQCFAGYEKWMMNSKSFTKNGNNSQPTFQTFSRPPKQ